ncbi:aspartic proteinase CDR1-like [Coffea eugenioides]|uniref:aspartic proteinase CDR1-like n=1 Tax=Coffea eugenioides TaxID=49369 RepID=UPI000F6132F6|nr:aspartic proteinase CDR1-like [Coffea eugenioides]
MRLNPNVLCTPLATRTVVFLVFCSTILLPVQTNNGGFTADLIRRDSSKSPFYNPLLTTSQPVKNAFQPSLNRANQFASTSVVPNGGEYLMKISYGTPPVETLAIVDTGSDVTWTMCLPCKTCHKSISSLFNPINSSTFELVPCTSKTCRDFSYSFCNQADATTCEYEAIYADLSSSRGDVATETITLEGSMGERLSFSNFTFGCAHHSDGDFTDEGMGSGLVGLGFEQQSLISQLSSSFHGKFSYCFGPPNEVSNPGKIRFGSNPIFLQGSRVSTPLYFGFAYSLKLQGISVANTRMEDSDGALSSGEFIIDSGTTYTLLPTQLYYAFESAIQDYIGSQNRVDDPNNDFKLCYSSLVDSVIPNITMHFAGADLELNPESIFQRTSPTSVCLGFFPSDSIALLGNLAQANFWVEYDLKNKILSFQRADCASQ